MQTPIENRTLFELRVLSGTKHKEASIQEAFVAKVGIELVSAAADMSLHVISLRFDFFLSSHALYLILKIFRGP